MPIGKSYQTQKAREEIEKILKTGVKEYQRNLAGKILFDLSRKYGNEVCNKIILELNLMEKVDIHPICPVVTEETVVEMIGKLKKPSVHAGGFVLNNSKEEYDKLFPGQEPEEDFSIFDLIKKDKKD